MYDKLMDLTDSLSRHIPVQNAAGIADVYGVEIELEGQKLKLPGPEVLKYWVAHPDGSLRAFKPGDECLEYVCAQPFTMPQLEIAMYHMFKFLNRPGTKVYESYRTSIHVHLNFAQETFRTIYNFMTISLILDELLTSQNGEHRIGNNFCLRAKDALGQVVHLIKSIEGGNNFFDIQPNDRYSSINFASLMKFGSIEFRSLECTTHEGRVMHWINTLAQIKEASKAFKNPIEVIQQFSQLGPQGFLARILGVYAMKYRDVPDADRMLRNGMRIAQDLAYCSSWKERDSK